MIRSVGPRAIVFHGEGFFDLDRRRLAKYERVSLKGSVPLVWARLQQELLFDNIMTR